MMTVVWVTALRWNYYHMDPLSKIGEKIQTCTGNMSAGGVNYIYNQQWFR